MVHGQHFRSHLAGDTEAMTEKTIMSEDDIRRALVRIAHEIVERNRGAEKLVMVGMHTRGVPLARRLAAIIEGFENKPVPIGTLDIGLYRDDLATQGIKSAIHRTDVPVDITAKRIVLVDDVLYTGRSIRAAMDALFDLGRPEKIQLAVLVDRGHRELPVRADYVGKNIPTSHQEEIRVHVKELDGSDEVSLVSP